MEIKALKDICQIIAGQSPPSDTYNQEQDGMPFFQGKADFGDLYPTVRYWCNAPKKLSKPNDILFSLRAPVGPTNVNNIDACIGRGLAAIRCEDVQLKYLLHYLRGNEHKIAALGTGSTFKAVTIGTLKDLEIPLPPLEEQKKIAAILDAADEHRQKTKALIDKYDQLTQSLFLDMFGDPVANPRRFEIVTVRDIIEEAKYGTSSKADENGTFPYLRMNNITYKGHMNYDNLKFINIADDQLHKYETRRGDILFNRTNSKELVGKTGIITTDEKMVLAGYLIRVRMKEGYNPYFLWSHLNSRWAKLTLENMCKNIVGMANINAQELQNLLVMNPPLKIQNQFAERVAEIDKQKQKAEASLVKAEELFNSLLQRAFKGELTC